MFDLAHPSAAGLVLYVVPGPGFSLFGKRMRVAGAGAPATFTSITSLPIRDGLMVRAGAEARLADRPRPVLSAARALVAAEVRALPTSRHLARQRALASSY